MPEHSEAELRPLIERLRRENARGLKLAHAVRHLGDALRRSDRLDECEKCYAEALEIYRAHPEVGALELANALRGAALLEEKLARRDRAIVLWQEAKTLYETAGVAKGVDEASRHLNEEVKSDS